MSTALADVVILVHNGVERLKYVLRSLTAQSLPKGCWSVYVTNDGSDEDIKAAVALFSDLMPLRVITLPVRAGRSAARNAGASAGAAPIVVFLDSDCAVGPDFLARHCTFHEADSNAMLAGGRLEVTLQDINALLDGRGPTAATSLESDWRVRSGLYCNSPEAPGASAPWAYAASCNLSVPRSSFERLGGFDEGMKGWGLEDIELGYRGYKAFGGSGPGVVFDPDLVCFHLPGVRDRSALHIEEETNRRYMIKKHRHYELELLWPRRWLEGMEALRYYRQLLAHYWADRSQCPAIVPDVLACQQGPMVLVGCPAAAAAGRGAKTFTLDHGLPLSADNWHLIGLSLPLEDLAADVVVHVDLWRHVPMRHFSDLLDEAFRVAQRVVLVDSHRVVAGMGTRGGDVLVGGATGYLVGMLRSRWAVELRMFDEVTVVALARNDQAQ